MAVCLGGPDIGTDFIKFIHSSFKHHQSLSKCMMALITPNGFTFQPSVNPTLPAGWISPMVAIRKPWAFDNVFLLRRKTFNPQNFNPHGPQLMREAGFFCEEKPQTQDAQKRRENGKSAGFTQPRETIFRLKGWCCQTSFGVENPLPHQIVHHKWRTWIIIVGK